MASAAREAPAAIDETGEEGLEATELAASEAVLDDDAGDELTVSPVKLAGNALAATRGWRWEVGWTAGAVIPQRWRHSAVPRATLSGI